MILSEEWTKCKQVWELKDLVQRIVLGKISLKDIIIYTEGKISNACTYTD